jgi:hypothetical protein
VRGIGQLANEEDIGSVPPVFAPVGNGSFGRVCSIEGSLLPTLSRGSVRSSLVSRTPSGDAALFVSYLIIWY